MQSSPEGVPTAPHRFEADIRAYEVADQQHFPPRHGAVYVGSSSIRLWPDVRADFPGWPVLNRGFGGSYLEEAVFFADRIVIPYQPRAVVVYAGENDLGQGRDVDSTFEQLPLFVGKVHAALPATHIFYLSVKPSPGRAPFIDNIRAFNVRARAWIEGTPSTTFIDVGTPMLGPDGFGRAEFFVADGIHMTQKGYDLWAEIIKPFLAPFFE